MKLLTRTTFLIVSFLLLLLFLTLQTRSLVRIGEFNQILSTNISNEKLMVKSVEDIYFKSLFLDGLKFPCDAIFYKNTDDPQPIDAILKGEAKLFILLPISDCQICVDILVDEINSLKEVIDSTDLVYFTVGDDLRTAAIFKSTYSMSSMLTYKPHKENDSVLKEVNVPLLFIVNRDHEISCVYFTDKSLTSKLTVSYLSIVGNRFFDWSIPFEIKKEKHHCSDSYCTH